MRNVYKLAATLLIAAQLNSQIAPIDPTFNASDPGFAQGDGPNNTIYSTAIQNDGKIIIGGIQNSYNSINKGSLNRLNADGSFDLSFNGGGIGLTGIAHSTLIQDDGKILIGGNFTNYNGTTQNRILRVLDNGVVDASFLSGTGANNTIRCMAIQDDGKIIIAGEFTQYNGTPINRIARLNTNGTLDESFIVGTGVDNIVHALAIQEDDDILLGGAFTSYNGTTSNKIVRINSDGSIDATFSTGTGCNNTVYSIAVQSDDNILVGGLFTSYNSTTKNRIMRLLPNGSLDGLFTATGTDGPIYSISIQSNDKIIIAGIFSSLNGSTNKSLARLNSDGTKDTGFNIGTGPDNTVYTTLIQGDGKIVIGGGFAKYNDWSKFALTRLNSDASLDESFNPVTGTNGPVYAIALQANDKLIVAGNFTTIDGLMQNYISRLNDNGSVDETFASGTGANGPILCMAFQTDGKIIIGGQFTSYNGTSRNRIARLNADGSLDTGFDPGTGAGAQEVKSIAIQSDGKIIIAGSFTTFNGTTRNRIARLNDTGSLDTGFDPGTGAGGTINSVLLQGDGKIIIGGLFTTFNGNACNRIARINSNGTFDAGYAIGTGANQVIETMAMQSNGKIIIAGNFTTYNGTNRSRIARLNDDGSLDPDFNPGSGTTGYLVAVRIQSDGKILIGGSFTFFGGLPVGNMARLSSDGTMDVNYLPNPGASAIVNSIELQSTGKIIIGGSFTSYNSTGRNRIARLLTTPCTPPLVNATSPAIRCGAGTLQLGATASSGTLNWYNVGGTRMGSGTSFTTPYLSSTTSFQVEAMDGCPSAKSLVTASIVNNNINITTVTSGNTITANQTSATYKWLDCNNNFAPIVGATSQSFTPTLNGNYAVEIKMSACIDTSACVPFILTGLADATTMNLAIKAFPNPCSGMFTVEVPEIADQISVTNELGEIIVRKTPTSESTILNLEGHPNGIYMVYVVQQNTTRVLKLVVSGQ